MDGIFLPVDFRLFFFSFSFSIFQNLCVMEEVSQRSFCHDVYKVYSKEKAGEGYKKKRIGKDFNLIRETL